MLGRSLAMVFAAVSSACASIPRYSGRVEPVAFVNGDVALSGILVKPSSAAPYSAVVFIHGSGPSTRDARAWKLHANAFNSRGFAVLVYDKRGSGESTGDLNKADYRDLAGDAAAAVHYLRTRPDIVQTRIGFFARSEGGWVAPIAADTLGDIAFVIMSSGAAVSPAEQTLYALRSELVARGASDTVIKAALDLRKRIWNHYARVVAHPDSSLEKERANLARELATFERWKLTEMPTGVARNDTSVLAPAVRNRYYDPIPALIALKSPLLAVLGAKDINVDPRTTSAALEKLRTEKRKDVTIKIYPGVDHTLFVWSKIPPGYVRGYLDFVTDWARAKASR